MIEYIRTLVSQDKQRYIDQDYNLDLTYITPRLAAMSFPSSGFEKTYRNDINQVVRFINHRHGPHFLVMNLSSRHYDTTKFDDKVWSCDWNDHQAPTLSTIFQGISYMHAFLEQDLNNTIFLHCNAGKGRTGTMICAYLVYVNGFSNTLDTRYYYSSKRFNAFGRGVTQPSQIRYIGYFAQLVKAFRLDQPLGPLRPKYLHKLVLKGFMGEAIGRDTLKPIGNSKIYEGKWPQGQKMFKKGDDEFTIQLDQKVCLLGDILVEVVHLGAMSNTQMFRLNINTIFLQTNVLKLYKNQIDPDKFQDKVQGHFQLELHFYDICSCWEYPPFQDQPLVICHTCSQQSSSLEQLNQELAQMKDIAVQYNGNAFRTKELLFGNPANDDIESFLGECQVSRPSRDNLSEEEEEVQDTFQE